LSFASLIDQMDRSLLSCIYLLRLCIIIIAKTIASVNMWEKNPCKKRVIAQKYLFDLTGTQDSLLNFSCSFFRLDWIFFGALTNNIRKAEKKYQGDKS